LFVAQVRASEQPQHLDVRRIVLAKVLEDFRASANLPALIRPAAAARRAASCPAFAGGGLPCASAIAASVEKASANAARPHFFCHALLLTIYCLSRCETARACYADA
jgi:hypothetical protein